MYTFRTKFLLVSPCSRAHTSQKPYHNLSMVYISHKYTSRTSYNTIPSTHRTYEEQKLPSLPIPRQHLRALRVLELVVYSLWGN